VPTFVPLSMVILPELPADELPVVIEILPVVPDAIPVASCKLPVPACNNEELLPIDDPRVKLVDDPDVVLFPTSID